MAKTLGAAAPPGPAPTGQPCARNGGEMEEAIAVDMAANLGAVRGRSEAAARAAGRAADAVTLAEVSKTHPAEAVRAALRAGQRVFGENRVQEALAKFPALRREFPDLHLHLIGPLQTTKAQAA